MSEHHPSNSGLIFITTLTMVDHRRLFFQPTRLFFLLCILFPAHTLWGQATSPLVYMDGGRLSYQPFAMEGQSNAVNVIPDFSHAGYKRGGVAIPDVPVQVTLSPIEGDNRAAIQAAIDQVAAMTPDSNGIRGAVLLRRGTYEVNGSLSIDASGVILRGEGQGQDGTILYASLAQRHDFLLVQGMGTGIYEDPATTTAITSPYVPVGATRFTVANAADFEAGDVVSVRRSPNQAWIDTLDMGQYGWTVGSYAIRHERVIKAIEGDTLTVDVPIVDVMETQFGGGTVSQARVNGRINQCGVENLRIRSYFASEVDEEHVWKAIVFRRAVNSWVKGVTAEYCGFACVSIEAESNFNTVEECAMLSPKSRIAGGRRYSFNIADGLGNLFQRCYTEEGRHDYVTSSRVTGPNVFLDCYALHAYTDIGPHHRWATGLLFDNIKGKEIRVQNRGSSGTGHGWAGAQTMFWNVDATEVKVESPIGGRNWGIGCVGDVQNGAGYWDNWGAPVLPRSLYLQQLADRLGPEAVAQVTTAAQRTGNIYDALAQWAGEGQFGKSSPLFTMRLTAIEDAGVLAITPNENYGSDTTLLVNASSIPSTIAETYLKFDVSRLPAAYGKALLRLYSKGRTGFPANEVLYVSNDDWSETTLTWSNKPNSSISLGEGLAPLSGQWLEIDVREQVDIESTSGGILSMRVRSLGNNEPVAYASSEHPDSTFRPEIAFTPLFETWTIEPIEDTYVQAGSFAAENYGMAPILTTESTDVVDQQRRAFVKFDLNEVEGEVIRAVLQLYVSANARNPRQNLYYVSDDTWSESTLTWNTQPAIDDSIATGLAPATGNWLELDITEQVQAELGTDHLLSLNLQAATSGHAIDYHSREVSDSTLRPRMMLTVISSESLITSRKEGVPTAGTGQQPNLIVYPNPANESIQVRFNLLDSETVSLTIRDLQGRSLAVLADGHFPRGEHALTWESDPLTLPSGVYLVVLNTPHGRMVQRLQVMR